MMCGFSVAISVISYGRNGSISVNRLLLIVWGKVLSNQLPSKLGITLIFYIF